MILSKYGIEPSINRTGNCWDNAPAESFFGSLKQEWNGDRYYRTRHDAMCDIREYIVVYYNSVRTHSSLEYMTPMEYEKCA